MSKKIKVIITKTHKILGKKNSIVKVSQGYAFNYLIPNKLAQIAREGELKHIKMIQTIEESKIAGEEYKNLTLQKNIEKIFKISIKKKVGDQQQIFGSINDREIIMLFSKYTGMLLDKKQIHVPLIKVIGIYSIKVEISHNKYAEFKLQILPSDANINL